MTKKDYELIAESLAKSLATWSTDTPERQAAVYAIKDTITQLAIDLYEENPKFDGSMFLEICGYNLR